MKGKTHPNNDTSLNTSGNRSIVDVVAEVNASRRRFVQTGVGAATLASLGGVSLAGFSAAVGAAPARAGSPLTVPISFTPIGPALAGSSTDKVVVPPGYKAELFVAWGDPIMPGGVPFSGTAVETAAQQRMAFGHHTDGMHFFPFIGRNGKPSSDRGLLVANTEYTHENILYPDGQVGASGYSIAKCRKSQAAHGVNVMEARRVAGRWTVQRSSPFGRRITANTFMRVSGPAAGHPLMQVKEFEITDSGSVATGATTDGRVAYGTANNCAHGITPWGTYLTCEENFNGYFGSTTGSVPGVASGETGKLYNRYGVTANGFGYRWHTVDPRWDLATNPNEPNLFGWIVEIDPFQPNSTPVKRTALGRIKHESVQFVVDDQRQVGFYTGDDERNDYIYKFVCAGRFDPRNNAANRQLLDSGVLYVARFDADGTGQWLPLTPESIGVDGVALRDNPNFAGTDDADVQAKILIKTRMAADALGATMMDRPEWIGARPRIKGFRDIELYCTLTNNNRRGTGTSSVNNPDGSTTAGSARPPVDAANPRADNVHGGVIRWREDGRSVTATTFTWDIFVECGDTRTTRTPLPTNDYRGNIVDDPDGSADYGAPDGLWFDPFGRMWVQTDSGDGTGAFSNLGMDQMVCVDPESKLTRRFLTAPNQAEVTGVVMTPDGRTMFVGLQHPGDDGGAANPEEFSSWPHNQWAVASDGVTPLPAGRPRSGIVVITKDDGGIIGT